MQTLMFYVHEKNNSASAGSLEVSDVVTHKVYRRYCVL